MSVTALAEQLDDDSGTWIHTSRYVSIFTWDFGKYSKIIVHPTSRLPQLQVNNGYSKFTSFCTFLENTGLVPIPKDAVFLCGAALSTDKDEDNDISKFLLSYSSKEQTFTSKPRYIIGQKLKLTKDGHDKNVTLDSVDVAMSNMVPSYIVRLKNGITTSVTKEYLSHIDDKMLSYIPITCDQIKEQVEYINPETLQTLLHANIPSPLLKEFLNLHEQLGHTPFVIIFRLCLIGPLPEKYLVLQEFKLLCPSCIFAQEKRTSWCKGMRKPGTIRKAHHINPGDGRMCDQSMSA